MGRIKLVVRYDGTDFAGSQIQVGERTVEGTLKAGLESIIGQGLKLLFASRTDAGVHADGNVCAFDADLQFPPDKLPAILSAKLPRDLEVRSAQAVAGDFHPRFDAIRRHYLYRVYQDCDVPVDRARYCFGLEAGLEIGKLSEVMSRMIGKHSFNHYSQGSLGPGDAICEIEEFECLQEGRELQFRLVGNRFLRNMVCRLAGALLDVGQGLVSPAQMLNALDNGLDFKFKPAPPRGLTLVAVDY